MAGWQLAEPVATDAEYPDVEGSSVDVNAQGQAIATWSTYDIWSERYRSRVSIKLADGWTAPMDVVTGEQAIPAQVAINDAGEALVIWEQSSPDPMQDYGRTLWARHYANGNWSSPQELTPEVPAGAHYHAYQFHLDKAGDGSFHLIWDNYSSDYSVTGVYYRRYADGVWSAQEKISESLRYVNPHRLHVMANGDLLYLYMEEEESTGKLLVRLKKRIGGIWGEAIALDTDVPANYEDPSITVDEGLHMSVNAGGDILVAWSAVYHDVANNRYLTSIFSKSYRAQTDTWSGLQISQPAEQQYHYQTALNDVGRGAVAWFQELEDSDIVEGNIRFIKYDLPNGTVSAEAEVYAADQAPFSFSNFSLLARANGDLWLLNIKAGLDLFSLNGSSAVLLGKVAGSGSVKLSCAEQSSAVACAWGGYNLAYPPSTKFHAAVFTP
ncbi:MAG: hypothetical protein ACOY41_05815 [Pseudomonadota bacterium]